MTKIIFVRHGESTGNELRRFYGQYDGELTERGREQARMTADFLKNTHIDIAYASSLSRAFETGEIIAASHGLEVIPEPSLREINAGEWENMEFNTIFEKYGEDFGIWINDLVNSRPTGGESVRELAVRIDAAVWKIVEANEGKTVLIATHATPIRTLIPGWRGEPLEAINDLKWVPNASVSIVNYDTAVHKAKAEIIGEASFMGELATRLPEKL